MRAPPYWWGHARQLHDAHNTARHSQLFSVGYSGFLAVDQMGRAARCLRNRRFLVGQRRRYRSPRCTRPHPGL